MSREIRGSILEQTMTRFRDLVEREHMKDAKVSVLVKPLTPEEAIGTPERRDFPIIIGKERVIEACVLDALGHAFTDSPQDFHGTLKDVLNLELNTNQNRAIFIATLNAALSHLNRVEATVHCKDEEPEKCALEIAKFLLNKYGK
ncbi:hypothetical protein ACFL54_08690, partial [Planctomycetota bacterium]